MHPHYVSNKPGDCPICHMKLVPAEDAQKRILFYRNPMDPRITSAAPAKDSMGMDYIPVYEEGEAGSGDSSQANVLPAGYGALLISPEKQQLVGIRTETVSKRNLSKTIRASGKVAYDPELYAAQLDFLQTVKKYTTSLYRNDPVANNSAERARLKLISMGLPEAMIQEIERSKIADKRLVYAVAGGEVWVYAFIFEQDIPLVKPGDRLEIRIPSMPSVAIEAPIRYIDNSLDPVTRTLRLRAVVKNDQGALKPDQFVDVTLRVDLGEVLALPADAVLPKGQTSLVFVDKGQGLFEPREVVLGQKTDGWVEVQSGVREGEKVVTSGNFLVDSESRIRGAISHG